MMKEIYFFLYDTNVTERVYLQT